MSSSQEIRDFFLMLRRRRVPTGVFALVTMLIAIAAATLLPTEYRSTAVLLFEEPDATTAYATGPPSRNARGNQPDIALEMDRISRQVLSQDELGKLIQDIDPYPDRPELTESDKVALVKENTSIEQVDPITLEPSASSPAYAIYYLNSRPGLARDVCAALVQRFTETNFESRTERAQDTYDFLEQQATKLRDEISLIEDRLATFKRKYGDSLPDSERTNREALERANSRLVDVNRQLRAAQDHLATVRIEKGTVNPMLANSGANVSQELADMERALAEARQKYTDDHPDVKRLKAGIENLRAQLSANAQAGNRDDATPGDAGSAGSGVAADNPQYIALANEEQSVLRDIDALSAQAKDLRGDIDDLRSKLDVAPEAEQQYLDVTRDYEIAQEKYQEIRRAQASAQLSIAMEANQQGQRISVIKAAGLPKDPFSPNRAGILMLGIFLAVAGGIAIAAMLEMLDASVRGARDLHEITNMPPLAMIPYISNRQDARRFRLRVASVGIATVAVAVLLVAVGMYLK